MMETASRLDVLDLWSVAPAAGDVAFAASAEAEAEPAAAWRLDLPAGDQAAERLRLAETGLAEIERALAVAPARLQRLAEREATPSFAAAAGTDLPAAEQELLAMLSAMRHQTEPGLASFGVAAALGLPSWADARAEIERQLHHAERLAAHYAWIETTVAGRLIGRTTVSWTGDLSAVWPAGASVEEQRLHERSVAAALATRAAILRIIAAVTAGAAVIAVAFASPAAAILTLPAVWRFIQRIRTEIAQLNPTPSEE
jgi:hypothetical protein